MVFRCKQVVLEAICGRHGEQPLDMDLPAGVQAKMARPADGPTSRRKDKQSSRAADNAATLKLPAKKRKKRKTV
jgi:hypothetical protein